MTMALSLSLSKVRGVCQRDARTREMSIERRPARGGVGRAPVLVLCVRLACAWRTASFALKWTDTNLYKLVSLAFTVASPLHSTLATLLCTKPCDHASAPNGFCEPTAAVLAPTPSVPRILVLIARHPCLPLKQKNEPFFQRSWLTVEDFSPKQSKRLAAGCRPPRAQRSALPKAGVVEVVHAEAQLVARERQLAVVRPRTTKTRGGGSV